MITATLFALVVSNTAERATVAVNGSSLAVEQLARTTSDRVLHSAGALRQPAGLRQVVRWAQSTLASYGRPFLYDALLQNKF